MRSIKRGETVYCQAQVEARPGQHVVRKRALQASWKAAKMTCLGDSVVGIGSKNRRGDLETAAGKWALALLSPQYEEAGRVGIARAGNIGAETGVEMNLAQSALHTNSQTAVSAI